MNFLSMEYFVVLAREKNFTRAAEKLHVTQQTLSAHIAALEKETGCLLFIRHVPLELTYGGEIFYKYAISFRKNEEALRRELADVSHSEAGKLTIGAAPTRGRVILPELVYAFGERYPKVAVEMKEGMNLDLVTMLSKGELDLAVAHFSRPAAGLHIEPFYEDAVCIAVSKALLKKIYREETGPILQSIREGKKGCFAPLARCPFVINSGHSVSGSQARRFFRENHIEPLVRVESDNTEMLLDLAVLGSGAFFWPQKDIAGKTISEEAKETLEIIPVKGSSYHVSFGYMADSYQWSMIRRFIDLAKDIEQGKAPLP